MIKFNTPAGSSDIVFIFLDRISTCQSTWTAELIKNLSDYVLTKIVGHGFNVIQGIDEDALLKEAAKDYTHAVVLSTGTEFTNGDEFFNEVEKLVYSFNKDFFLMGHIPDRDDGYYELHEQCYIINLTKYTKLGSPMIGEFAYYSEHTQIEPLRSVDNVHDDYTPIWIKSGLKLKKYKHKWHGWNIISQALAAGEHVEVFPEQFRTNKKYYYPNYEPSFIPSSTYLYGKQAVAGQTLFYPFNTERLVDIDFTGPIGQLVIQASGLQWVNYLLKYGYNNNTLVRFVDYNLFALECMHAVVSKWKGEDYSTFVKDYANSRASFVNKEGTQWLTFTGQEQVVTTEQWVDIISKVKFEFRHEDLVLNKQLDVDTWVDNSPNTIIHLSHIFNYDPVATFYPYKHRLYSEQRLLEKLKKHVPEATIILIDSLTAEPLPRPTWHMNGDWNGI
jgi:hypothetical protein